MSAEPLAVLKELLDVVKDERRKALVEAYLAKADSRSMADRALEMLSERLDADHST